MRFLMTAALLIAATACGKYKEDPLPDSLPAYKDSVTVDSGGAMRSTSLYSNASYSTFAPGDSGTYKVLYSLASPLPVTDTVQLRLGNDSLSALTARRTAQRDSASFKVAKVYGRTAKWYACRRVLRAGVQVQTEKCTTWTTNLPSRLPDSVWVDSTLAIAKLDVKPDTGKITTAMWRARNIYQGPNGLVDSTGRPLNFTCPANVDRCPGIQFCGFVVFRDGKVAMRDEQSGVCPNEYSKIAASKRAVSQEQQLIANGVCTKWSATGGAIQSEPCTTQPAWLRQYVPLLGIGDTIYIQQVGPPPLESTGWRVS